MVDKSHIEMLLRLHFANFMEEIPLVPEDYEIDDLGQVSTHIGVYMKRKTKDRRLPVKFREVVGDFSVSGCELVSLEGCPSFLTGDFWCEGNNLTTLEHAPPTSVNISCSNNKLANLLHCPGNTDELQCDGNLLKSLETCPPTKFLYAINNPFEHFRNTPSHIDEIVVTAYPNLPLLALLTVKKINLIDPDTGKQMEELTAIMNRYAGQGKAGAFDCRREMRASGYESNAQW